jgi:hypothetical protein
MWIPAAVHDDPYIAFSGPAWAHSSLDNHISQPWYCHSGYAWLTQGISILLSFFATCLCQKKESTSIIYRYTYIYSIYICNIYMYYIYICPVYIYNYIKCIRSIFLYTYDGQLAFLVFLGSGGFAWEVRQVRLIRWHDSILGFKDVYNCCNFC